MAMVTIEGGMILKQDEIRWRILGIQDGMVTMIQMDVTFRNFQRISLVGNLIPGIENKTYTLVEDHPLTIAPENLSPKTRATFERNRRIISKVEIIYGNNLFYDLADLKRKPELNEIQKEFEIESKCLRRLILRYLQSGFADDSFIDHRAGGHNKKSKGYQYKRRPGRVDQDPETASTIVLTDELKSYFEEAIKWVKDGICLCLSDSFAMMKDKHFRQSPEEEEKTSHRHLPITACPTIRQFYFYASKNFSQKERTIAAEGEKNWDNNNRPLLGNANLGVKGVGDRVECDIIDADIFLSAFDDQGELRTVGKPHVYMGIDVSTRLILAVYVTYTNNSMDGARGFFANFAEDKVKMCKKYGIEISPDEWPSDIYPLRVSFDNGADFASDQMSTLLAQLGIERVLQPTAMGSMKPCIERNFRELTNVIKTVFQKMGVVVVTKKYKDCARLDIDDFTKVVLYFVTYHNKKYMEYYPISAEMIEAEVEPTPRKLYEFMISKYGCKRIRNRGQFLWNCLVPARASINRNGIIFRKLSYLPSRKDDPELFGIIENFSKTQHLEIRYSPTDMNQVYYMRSEKRIKAPLNENKAGNSSFKDMTEEEVKALQKKQRHSNKLGRHCNDEKKCAMWEKMREVRDEASSRPSPKSDKMTEMHGKEKAKHLHATSPTHMLNGQEESETMKNKTTGLPEDSGDGHTSREPDFERISLWSALDDYDY